MKLWKQKHSVCSECGVHFEPVTGYEARWGNLCAAHRKAVKERDEKKDAVVAWASANWERLAKTMEEETASQRAAYNNMMQANIAQMAAPKPAGELPRASARWSWGDDARRKAMTAND